MIKYHGCPISGGEKTQLAYQSKHAFISYAGQSYMELIVECCQSFALDNGAFSAWKAGKAFDFDGFCEWLEIWHRHPAFDFFCLPDVIDGDHHANQLIRAKFFNAVPSSIYKKGAPVWHLHEPLEVLRDMVNGYDRVCFGSSGQYSEIGTPQWWSRMSEAMPYVTDELGRPTVKIHGLRMLDPTIFSHFPFSSADSTNVARNAGIDGRWIGPYAPKSKSMRAILMMDRIEAHCSAQTWSQSNGVNSNYELFG